MSQRLPGSYHAQRPEEAPGLDQVSWLQVSLCAMVEPLRPQVVACTYLIRFGRTDSTSSANPCGTTTPPLLA